MCWAGPGFCGLGPAGMLSPAQAHLVGWAWAGLGLYTDIGVLGVHPAYLGIVSEIGQLTASS